MAEKARRRALPKQIDHGVLTELVTPDRGRIVETDEQLDAAIIELLGDSDLSARLGTAARDYITKHHERTQWIASYVDVYRMASSPVR